MKVVDNYFQDIKNTIEQIPIESLEEVIDILQTARLEGKHIFIMGNGGSASTASHFVCDLAKSTQKRRLPDFRVIGLTDNMAAVTAYANDDGYESIFLQQLSNLLQPGDVVIAISASGNSKNVIKAVEYANSQGAVTIGFTGMTGGVLKTISQKYIHVQNETIDQVEDIHLMIEHIICRTFREMPEPAVEINPPEIIFQENDELIKGLFGNSIPMLRKTGKFNRAAPSNTELLSKISNEFASKLDLHDLLSRILCITVEYVGAVGGSIVVLDENGGVIDGALAYAGKILDQTNARLGETIHHGLASWVLENRRPALVENTKEDPRWLPRRWEATLDLSRSAICVPLLTQDRVIGVLTLTRMQSNRFSMEDLSLLTSITLALSYSFTSKPAIRSSQ